MRWRIGGGSSDERSGWPRDVTGLACPWAIHNPPMIPGDTRSLLPCHRDETAASGPTDPLPWFVPRVSDPQQRETPNSTALEGLEEERRSGRSIFSFSFANDFPNRIQYPSQENPFFPAREREASRQLFFWMERRCDASVNYFQNPISMRKWRVFQATSRTSDWTDEYFKCKSFTRGWTKTQTMPRFQFVLERGQ